MTAAVVALGHGLFGYIDAARDGDVLNSLDDSKSWGVERVDREVERVGCVLTGGIVCF